MKQTFSQYYAIKFDTYEQFKKETNNILYIEQDDGQIKMEFITPNTLCYYGDYLVDKTWICNFNLHIILKKKEI